MAAIYFELLKFNCAFLDVPGPWHPNWIIQGAKNKFWNFKSFAKLLNTTATWKRTASADVDVKKSLGNSADLAWQAARIRVKEEKSIT